MSDKTTRCTTCRVEFSDEEMVNVECCPACSTTAVPCAINRDVMVKINTHELRILFIWAENWARTFKDDKLNSMLMLDNMAQAVESQLPAELWAPMTMTRELKDLKENFPKSKITYIDETGTETNL